MKAPKYKVQLSDGRSVPLESLYRDRPVALIFLRHLGCIFCERNVAQWKEDKTTNVVFVCRAKPEDAEAFRARMQSPQAFICDEAGKLYEAFGVRQGSMSQIFNMRAVTEGFRAYREGFRNAKPATDPTQLGGCFVIDTKGEVTYEERAEDAAFYVWKQLLIDELNKARV